MPKVPDPLGSVPHVARQAQHPVASEYYGMGITMRALPLYLLIFVDAMGFAMIVPILAVNSLSDDAFVNSILYGVAIGIYPLATFFAAPVLGVISDRKGRRPVMLVCGGGLVASYGMIALGLEGGSAALVILGRLMGGLTAATQALALAALSGLGAPETKANRISYGLLSSSLGFVIGPVLSGVLVDIGPSARFDRLAPLVAIMVLGTVTVAWLARTYREVHAPSAAAERGALREFLESMGELRRAIAAPVLRRLSAIFFLQQLAWGAFFFFIPTFLVDRFDFDASGASYYMGVLGVGFCVSFAIVTPVLRKFLTSWPIAVGAMVATTTFITAAVVAPSAGWQWALAVPVSVAVSLAYGAIIAMFADEAAGHEGGVLGATASINALSFGLTSIVGGVIAGAAVVAPIIAAAILMALSTLLLLPRAKLE